ncbi:Multidrug resistance protein 1 [Gaertneriomyces sp. JEL0708]|nr:Multidrug resistance protein 1 [Gaertneriomyces sp. JEL0708]
MATGTVLPDPTGVAQVEHIELDLDKARDEAHVVGAPAVVDIKAEQYVHEPDDDSVDESEKSKKKKNKETGPRVTFMQLFRHADKRDVFLMVLGTVCAIAHGVAMPLMTVIFSSILAAFIDYEPNNPVRAEALRQSALDTVMWFCILAIACAITAYGQMSLWMWSGENQVKRMRELYFRAIVRQDVAWFDKTSTGELTTRITNDMNTIQSGISEKMGSTIQNVVTFIAGFALAYARGWRLALVLTACFPFLAGAAAVMGIMVTAGSEQTNDAYAAAGGVAQQVLSSMRTVVAFGGQGRESARYAKHVKAAEKAAMKKSLYIGLGVGAINFVIFAIYSMSFWYGARELAAERMTQEEVVNCFFALIIGAFALGTAMPNLSSAANAQGAAYKVFETIDRQSPIDASSSDGEKPDNVEGDINFTAIDFHYPSRPDVPILQNFSLEVKSGQTVALVGASGSGKSTIVKLLERFYNPVSGSISLDGRDISSLNVAWLRQQIGIVSQEPILFDTTIRNNLLYGLIDEPGRYDKRVLDDMVETACKIANAWTFIQALPDKLETNVGEAGSMLSGGQKQRIAIARAVLRNPKILLLDEATSALDTQSERIVQAALDSAAKGRTTIVIAHRLSTIKNADQIIVMDRGVIVETGTHESLVAKGTAYAKLVEAQKLRGAFHEQGALEDGHQEHVVSTSGGEVKSGDAPVVLHVGSKPDAPVRKESLEIQRKLSVASQKHALDEEEEKKLKETELLKSRKVDLWRIVKMNRPEWWIIIVGLFAAAVNGTVMPLFAVLFSEILAVFSNEPNVVEEKANPWALGFLLLAIGAAISNLVQIGGLSIVGDKLTTRLRQKSFDSMIRQEIAYFDDESHSTGALTARLAEEATLVQGLTGQNFAQMAQLAVNFSVGIGIAFASSWQVTLVVLACCPMIAFGGYMEMQAMAGYSEKSKKAYRASNQTATETIEHIRTVQSLTKEEHFIQEYIRKIETPHRMVLRGALVSSIGFAASEALMFITYAIAFFYCSRLILWGTYVPLDVLKAMFAIVFAAMAIGQSTHFAPDIGKAKIAAIHIFDILDRVPAIDTLSDAGQKPSQVSGTAEAKQVHFAYPTRPDAHILRGIDIEAKPGETIALVGQSGCGKSTMLGLLERWYDVTGGTASFSQLDVREWNVSYLRSQMSLVGQEPVLFDLSISENIAYGAREGQIPSEEEIQAAARMANIHDFIVSLPKGYDTIVGEKGGQLSGGQKQRVAIARALLRQPSLLLLDEATSALDSTSERVVQAALDNAAKGRTTIVIAHRLSTIQNADRIYVFKDGRIVESGRHGELAEQGGLYAELVGQQMLGAEK